MSAINPPLFVQGQRLKLIDNKALDGGYAQINAAVGSLATVRSNSPAIGFVDLKWDEGVDQFNGHFRAERFAPADDGAGQ